MQIYANWFKKSCTLPCNLRGKKHAYPVDALHTFRKYGPSISERLRVECVLGNIKIEMHTPFAGIILCRFKGTFSAHITTIQTKRPSDC
jgi:hypothetical protein